MTILVSRVDLSDGVHSVQIDADQALRGLQATIVRARTPTMEWDGNGDLVLVYGLGRDRRKLTVAGTTRPLKLPPNLSTLTLTGDIVATLTWPDASTTTVITGTMSGIESAAPDLIGGTTAWSFSLVGPVSSGWDPVGGD